MQAATSPAHGTGGIRFRRRSFAGLEIAVLDGTRHVFERHFHDDFVIGANIVGRETIHIDRRTVEASVSDVTLYNPGQVQAGSGRGNPWAFYSLYVAPPVMASLLGTQRDIGFEAPVLEAAPLAARLRAACATALAPDMPAAQAEERLALALAALVRHGTVLRPAAFRAAPSTVARVAAQLLDEIAVPPTLGALARTHGLSRVQLVRTFERVHGLPPFAWLAQKRLVLARARLARGEAPADVAAALGFSDQAHLTRRFKAAFGVPPARWARG